jgi:asparagine synthase (glutamine-hydrolysing)
VGYEEEAFSELHYARQMAQHIGSRHYEVRLSREDFFAALPSLIWHEDEPITWPSSVSLYFLAKLAREQVTVVLTGEGSDEMLGGYFRYSWTMANSRMDRAYRSLTPAFARNWIRDRIGSGALPSNLRRRLEHTFLGRDGTSWPSFYFDNFYSAFSVSEQNKLLTPKVHEQCGDAYAGSMAVWERSSGDVLHRLLCTDIHTYLVELLMKQDQMSMAASIESRVPFLDHILVEFAARIPAQYLVQGFSGKQVLKLALQDVLPPSIIHRRKMGFPTPWRSWLTGPQFDSLENMLLEVRAVGRGLFEPEAVRTLFAEHRSGRRDNCDRIWRLINLEIWHRVFLDGDLPTSNWTSPQNAIAVTPRQVRN